MLISSIKSLKLGKVSHPDNILPAIVNDGGQYAMRSSMLQSCGGVRISEPQNLINMNVPYYHEINNHKCVMVHHNNPYTKLGPFKTEYVHHNPFFLLIHDLLTEEDMNYLKVWATPRLSRKRDNYDKNTGRVKVGKGEWVEDVSGNIVKSFKRTVGKSVQEGLDISQTQV